MLILILINNFGWSWKLCVRYSIQCSCACHLCWQHQHDNHRWYSFHQNYLLHIEFWTQSSRTIFGWIAPISFVYKGNVWNPEGYWDPLGKRLRVSHCRGDLSKSNAPFCWAAPMARPSGDRRSPTSTLKYCAQRGFPNHDHGCAALRGRVIPCGATHSFTFFKNLSRWFWINSILAHAPLLPFATQKFAFRAGSTGSGHWSRSQRKRIKSPFQRMLREAWMTAKRSRTCLLGSEDMGLLRRNSIRSNHLQAALRRSDMTCIHRTTGKHPSA